MNHHVPRELANVPIHEVIEFRKRLSRIIASIWIYLSRLADSVLQQSFHLSVLVAYIDKCPHGLCVLLLRLGIRQIVISTGGKVTTEDEDKEFPKFVLFHFSSLFV